MKKILLILLLTFLLSSVAHALDSNTQGFVPEFFSIYLNDSNGGINATEDYSSSPKNLTIQPPPGQVWRLSRMIISVKDTNINNFEVYAGAGILGNGFNVQLEINETKLTKLDGENDGSIKSLGDFLERMYDCQVSSSLGNNIDYFTCRWTFDKAGTKIRLDGDNNDKLFIEFKDDLTTLEDHVFLIQGYKEAETNPDIKNLTQSTMSIGIIIAILFIITLYIVMIRLFTTELFSDNGFIKVSFIVLSMWLSLFLVQTSTLFNQHFSGPAGVTDILNTLYSIMVYINYFVSFYFFLFFMIKIFNKLRIVKNG